MIFETVNLKNHYKTLYNDVALHSYCPSNYDEYSANRLRKCVIVLPGGGYSFRSRREEEAIAYQFLAADMAVFVLDYSIADKIKYPCPMAEVFAAVAYIRKNNDYYHVNPNAICVIGFSAGGHLAASSAAFCHKEEYAKFLNVDLKEIEINGCILSYPVICSTYSHLETIKNISQGDEKLKELFSIEKHVTKEFPKTFIWHTTFDDAVSVSNSLRLANEFEKNKVFFEMHIYPVGNHGISLANETVYRDDIDKQYLKDIEYSSQWIKQAIHFVDKYI